jgi:hypothetical protein
MMMMMQHCSAHVMQLARGEDARNWAIVVQPLEENSEINHQVT